MTGAGVAPFRALRGKLNQLNYHEPLSEDSAELAQRLLEDLLKTVSSVDVLRRKIDGREQEVESCTAALDALRREHPRLLKENLELHHRLLSDAGERQASVAHWDCCVNTAQEKLAQAKALQQLENDRATEFHESAQLLRMQLEHLRRAGAGVAVGVRPRQPSMSASGIVPQRQVPHSAATDGPEELVDVTAQASRIAELSSELAGVRQERAALAGQLENLVSQASDAKGELSRLQGDTLDGSVGAAPEKARPDVRAEESQLASRKAFVDRGCEELGDRRKFLESEVSEVEEKIALLAGGCTQFERDIAAMRLAAATREVAGGRVVSDQREQRLRRSLDHRKALEDWSQLAETHARLEADVQTAHHHAESVEQDKAQRIRELRQQLAQVRAQSLELKGEQQVLPDSPRESTDRDSILADLSADLSSQLAAVRLQEQRQKRSLSEQTREAEVSLRESEAGVRKMEIIHSQRNNLEVQVSGVRAETEALHSRIEETAKQCKLVSFEREAARTDVEELREEEGSRRQNEQQVTVEISQVRANALQTEAAAARVRHEEDVLQTKSEQLRHGLAQSESQLSTVQRKHRQLSSGVDRLITDLLQAKTEQKQEYAMESELNVLMQDAQDELRDAEIALAEAGQDSQVEVRRWDMAIHAIRSGLARLATSEHSEEQSMIGQAGIVQASVDHMRHAIAEAAEDGACSLRASADVAAGVLHAEDDQMIKLGDELKEHEAASSAKDKFAQEEEAQATYLLATAARLQSELEHRRCEVEEGERAESGLESSAREWASEGSVANASLIVSRRRLEEVTSAEGAMRAGVEEMEEQQQQFGGLITSLSTTRERLVGDLRDVDATLAQERQLCRAALEGPAEAKAQVQELAAECQRLRQAVAAMDGDHVEMHRLAQVRREELERLRRDGSRVQAAWTETQWKLDRLRRASDLQQGELASCAQDIEHAAREAKAIEIEVERVASELQERRRDAALTMEDLVHTTRENQLLHDEVLQMQRRDRALSTGVEEHQALALPRAQALQGALFEREQALEAYQEEVDRRQRNERAIAELARQEVACRGEAEALHDRLMEVEAAEQEERAKALQGGYSLTALQIKLSDAARTLEMHEIAREEADADRLRAQAVVGLRQGEISRAYLGDAAAAADVDALRADVGTLQSRLQAMQAEDVDGKQQLGAAQARQRQLQAALASERMDRQRVSAEAVALCRRIEERQSGARPSAASVGSETAAVAALRQTLVQQGALIAEMSVEGRSLAVEVLRLRGELGGSARASPQASVQASPQVSPQASPKPSPRPTI